MPKENETLSFSTLFNVFTCVTDLRKWECLRFLYLLLHFFLTKDFQSKLFVLQTCIKCICIMYVYF